MAAAAAAASAEGGVAGKAGTGGGGGGGGGWAGGNTFKANRGGSGFVDAPQELLDLMDKAKVEIDDTKRLDYYNQLQKMLCDLCPAIPAYSPNMLCAMDSDILGVTLTEFNDINWSKAYKAN